MTPGQILGAITAAQTLIQWITEQVRISKRNHTWTESEELEFRQRLAEVKSKWARVQDFVEDDPDPLDLTKPPIGLH